MLWTSHHLTFINFTNIPSSGIVMHLYILTYILFSASLYPIWTYLQLMKKHLLINCDIKLTYFWILLAYSAEVSFRAAVNCTSAELFSFWAFAKCLETTTFLLFYEFDGIIFVAKDMTIWSKMQLQWIKNTIINNNL